MRSIEAKAIETAKYLSYSKTASDAICSNLPKQSAYITFANHNRKTQDMEKLFSLVNKLVDSIERHVDDSIH